MTNAEFYVALEELAQHTMVLVRACGQDRTKIDDGLWQRLCVSSSASWTNTYDLPPPQKRRSRFFFGALTTAMQRCKPREPNRSKATLKIRKRKKRGSRSEKRRAGKILRGHEANAHKRGRHPRTTSGTGGHHGHCRPTTRAVGKPLRLL